MAIRSSLNCPSPEELGALAEGLVSPARKAELLGHIDICPDCFEIFAAAAAFRAEELASGGQAPVRNGRRSPAFRVGWLAVAAAIVLALFLWRPFEGETRLGPSRELVAAMSNGISPGLLAARVQPPGLFLPRFGGALSEQAMALQTGRTLIDFHIFLEAGHPEKAQALLQALFARAGGDPRWAPVVEEARNLGSEISGGDPRLDSLEKKIGTATDPFFLELGKWAESCRIAASVGAVQYLNRQETSDFVGYAVSQPTPGPIHSELQALQKLWRGENVGEPSLREIEERTGDLFTLLN